MNVVRALKLAFVVALAYFSLPLLVLDGVKFQAADGNLPLSLLLGATLIFHEAGHWVFSFFGQFITVCGGSLMQLLVPIVCLVAFARQRQYFAAGFALYWLGVSGINLSYYVADARAQALQLISDDALHDWHFILDRLNLLQYDLVIGHTLYCIALIAGLGGLAWMVWAVFGEKEEEFPIAWE
jgi:hypothetical protein